MWVGGKEEVGIGGGSQGVYQGGRGRIAESDTAPEGGEKDNPIPSTEGATHEMSSRPISLEARLRLRAQQAEEARVVAAHAGACARLQSTLARRSEVVAAQDELVAKAETGVAAAAATVVAVSGFARAVAILDVAPATLRRMLAVAKAHKPTVR